MYIPPKKSRLFRRRNNIVSGEHYSFSSSSSGVLDKYPPEIKRKILKYLLYAVGIFIFLIITMFVWYSRDLPNPYRINNRNIAQSTQILDRNGKLLYEVHGEENRTLMKIDDIPENIKKATVAIEDQDFYKHMGIDIRGVVRAFVYDILHRTATQGGSTITQQFVKNALLTSDKSFVRKIKELILSIEIEKVYSKNEILGMYLNEIPYGNNAYGIYSASKTYFDKEPKDLTLAESALLASIPQAPTYYNPYGSNTDILIARKDYVLDKMVELQLITKDQADQAKGEQIKFAQQDQGILAPHFVMYVKELLAEKYGESKLAEGGFIVTTSLDLDKQKIAEDDLTKSKANLKASGASNAALVSMDPKNGEILAMVGSVDYFDTKNDGNVNVAIRPRQPGSSLKPFIYGLAFNQGYAPSTMMMDVETDFGQGYKPKNYDGKFRGPISIRRALGNSLNIPAVETLALVGLKNATDFSQKMGLTTLNDPNRYGLSLVLGGGEVKLLEEVNAYSTLANQGIKYDIHPILKVTDASGKVLEEYKPEEDKGIRVLDENPTYLVTNILSDDSARAEEFGMGGILTLAGRPVAAKTGTTDEFRDAWTFGYTPSVATGVWVGNNNNSEMVHGSAGAMVAAPIWNSYMKQVLAGTPAEQFAVPSGIVKIPVDTLTGKLPLSNLSPEISKQLPTVDGVFWNKFPPKETDNVHKIVKVVKGDDKLAGKDCPPNLVEEKVFLEFHSIDSTNPNWESAVTAWAKTNNYNNIPTEEDDCKDIVKENQPTLTINSPAANSDVSGKLNVTISYIAKKDVDKVEYFLDEEKIAEKDSGPENAGNNYNLEDFALPASASGKAVLKVVLTDKIGLTATEEISINIK